MSHGRGPPDVRQISARHLTMVGPLEDIWQKPEDILQKPAYSHPLCLSDTFSFVTTSSISVDVPNVPLLGKHRWGISDYVSLALLNG